MDNELSNRIVLMLTNGMRIEAAEAYAVQAGETPGAARKIVVEARKRITLAADFDRDEQLGKAVSRLEDLYAKSIVAKDPRTALQAQKELNRLLALYDAGGDSEADGGDDEAARQLELIAGYLLPLELTDEGYPVEEHARIAAEIIRRTREAE